MKKQVEQYLYHIADFIRFLEDEPHVYIQAHDFPDPDAVASAFGLQYFLARFGIRAHLVYEKVIQRDALKKMIDDLHIDIRNIKQYDMTAQDKIVLVDGCKGNANVTNLIGNEVGVIDHHQVSRPEDVEFSDIRPDYGACASIIATYFLEADIDIPQNVATAFMIGIHTDTSFLTRGVSLDDLRVFFHCYPIADMHYVNGILRNNIRIPDLEYYKFVIENLEFRDALAFCHIPHGCDQNLLGILANFVLSLEEVLFVVLCAKNGKSVNFSVRSETPDWNAVEVIRSTLEGIGFGGGHADMAGGAIPNSADFDKHRLFDHVASLLDV